MTQKQREVVPPRGLRYLAPENIAADFTAPREREAIAAVFSWLGLNAVCAHHVVGNAYAASSLQDIDEGKTDTLVLSDAEYTHARQILGLDHAPKKDRPRAKAKKAHPKTAQGVGRTKEASRRAAKAKR